METAGDLGLNSRGPMNKLSPDTRRNHPPGTVIRKRRAFGCGIYERVHAKAGPFSASYAQHAIVLSGESVLGHVQLNGGKISTGPTTAPTYSVFRPGDLVRGEFGAPTIYEIVLLCPNFVEQLLRQEMGPRPAFLASTLRVEMPPVVRSIWRRLSRSIEQSSASADDLVSLCLEILIFKLVEGQLGTPNPADAGDHLAAIGRALDYIETALGQSLDVKSIAGAAGLSPYYFNRVFKAAQQTSVHRYVLDRRLARARELLATTEQAIAAIAIDTGFSSQSHLTTAFRQRFGVTPAQFRLLSRPATREGGSRREGDEGHGVSGTE